MPGRADAMRGAGVLAALVRRGTLGTDPEVLGMLADLILYVCKEDAMDTLSDEVGRLRRELAAEREYGVRLRSKLAEATARCHERAGRVADLEAECESLRQQLDQGEVGVSLPFGEELRGAA
ncbi:hypothetical protein [Gemmata sp.]|uniref:hypothetical protein n=1 Tax=Gemmata sp. TaxID=1914242 RepID=UPI003F6E5EE8